MTETLAEILERNQWNGSNGTDKNTDHDYINSFYDREFKKYKTKKINILEIGTCRGTSIHLWQEYFPKAEIIGIDVKNYLQEQHKELPRVQYIFDNAYDANLASSLPDFDIIIDDGTHSLEDQIKCLNLYIPKLKKRGVLVIEDIQDFSFFETLKNSVPDDSTLKIECLDLRQNKGRYDDMMFIVRKV